MKTAKEIAKQVVDAFWGFPAYYGKAEELIAKALTKFAEDHAKEVYAPAMTVTVALVSKNARNATLEEAAKIAEFHSGPSAQLAEKIRALKSPVNGLR